ASVFFRALSLKETAFMSVTRSSTGLQDAAATTVAVVQVRLSRNLVLQLLVAAMVAMTTLTVLPWRLAAAWSVVAGVAILAEDRLMRVAAEGEVFAHVASRLAPWLRVMLT